MGGGAGRDGDDLGDVVERIMEAPDVEQQSAVGIRRHEHQGAGAGGEDPARERFDLGGRGDVGGAHEGERTARGWGCGQTSAAWIRNASPKAEGGVFPIQGG